MQPSLARILKYAGLIIAGLIFIWLAIRLTGFIMVWTLYSRFFEKIHTIGAVPDFLSGAIAVWCVAAVLIFTPALLFSIFVKRQRKMILIVAAGISLWMIFLYGISTEQQKNLFNPITGAANYSYSKDATGNIKLFPRGYSFDPTTGEKLTVLDGTTAGMYRDQEAKDQTQLREPPTNTSTTKRDRDANRISGFDDTETTTIPKASVHPETLPTIENMPEVLQGPPAAVFDQGTFHATLNYCKHLSSQVNCFGKIEISSLGTGTGEKNILVVFHKFHVSGADGKEYGVRSGQFGDSSYFGSAYSWQKVTPGIPKAFSFVIDGMEKASDKINIVMPTNQSVDGGEIVFRNIPIN